MPVSEADVAWIRREIRSSSPAQRSGSAATASSNDKRLGVLAALLPVREGALDGIAEQCHCDGLGCELRGARRRERVVQVVRRRVDRHRRRSRVALGHRRRTDVRREVRPIPALAAAVVLQKKYIPLMFSRAGSCAARRVLLQVPPQRSGAAALRTDDQELGTCGRVDAVAIPYRRNAPFAPSRGSPGSRPAAHGVHARMLRHPSRGSSVSDPSCCARSAMRGRPSPTIVSCGSRP